MKNLKLAFAGMGLAAVLVLSGCGETVEEVEFKRSTVSGTVVSNEMIGIGVDFVSDWEIEDDDTMAYLNGISEFTEENIKSVFDKSGILYDAYAMYETGDNVSVIIEDLSVTVRNAGISEEKYVDIAYPSLESQLTAQGITVDDISRDTLTFAGAESPCVKIKISVSGTTLYEYQLYKKAGKYMGIYTITAVSEEGAKELADKFYAL